MIIFISFYALGNVCAFLLAALLQPRLVRWRFLCAQRNALAHWSRLSLLEQQRAVAMAWHLAELPLLAEDQLRPLLIQACDERWAAMQRQRSCADLVVWEEDLSRLALRLASSAV